MSILAKERWKNMNGENRQIILNRLAGVRNLRKHKDWSDIGKKAWTDDFRNKVKMKMIGDKNPMRDNNTKKKQSESWKKR